MGAYGSIVIFIFGFLLQLSLIIWSGNLSFSRETGFFLYFSEVLACSVSFLFVFGIYRGVVQMVKQKGVLFSCLVGILFNLLWLLFLIVGLILSFLGMA